MELIIISWAITLLALVFFHDMIIHFIIAIFLFLFTQSLVLLLLSAFRGTRLSGIYIYGKGKELFSKLFKKKKVDVNS